MIDLHAHILPGLDDGARSIEESRELARSSIAEGVTAIAATPHVRADYPTRAAEMQAGVQALRRDFEEQGIEIEVLPGAEVEIARLWQMSVEELTGLTLGGSGRYVLIEAPYRGPLTAVLPAISFLAERELTAVLAHPERNPEVQDHPHILRDAVEAGALVQITSASLDGRLGPASRAAAGRLLDLHLVHFVGSDAHGPHIRGAGLEAAARAIDDQALARYLTVDVPAAIVAGDAAPRWPSVATGNMLERRKEGVKLSDVASE